MSGKGTRPAGHPLGQAIAPALGVAGYFLPAALGGSASVYNALVVIAIFSVMAYGVDMILSYLGEVSLGHTVFWAAGCYAAGLCAVRLGWNGWATAAAAVAVCLALALVLGLLTLRTREFVFSLVTYAAAVVAMSVAHNWSVVGGSDGIVGIPLLELPLPGLTIVAGGNEQLWTVAYLLLLLVIGFVHRFRRSRLGQAALMVHMNPDLATMLGVDTRRVRLAVFVLSAPVTGLAGWLYAYQRAYVGPDLFGVYFLVVMLTAVIVTGRRVLLGPLVGTSLIVVQQSFFSIGGDGDRIVLGLALVSALLFFPEGLIGLWTRVRASRSAGRRPRLREAS